MNLVQYLSDRIPEANRKGLSVRLHCCVSRIWYNLLIPSRRGDHIVSGPGVECQLEHVVWTRASILDHYKGTVIPEVVTMLELTAMPYAS